MEGAALSPGESSAQMQQAIAEFSQLCDSDPRPLLLSVETEAVNFGLIDTARQWYGDPQKRRLFHCGDLAAHDSTVIQQQLACHAADPRIPGDLARAQLLAESVLDQVQVRWHRLGITTYTSNIGSGWPDPNYFLGLVLGDWRWLIIEGFHCHFGADEEEPHDSQGFIRWLQQLDQEYPFMIRHCYGAELELVFLEAIAHPTELAERFYRICSDVVTENGGDGTLAAVAERLHREQRIRLWWD